MSEAIQRIPGLCRGDLLPGISPFILVEMTGLMQCIGGNTNPGSSWTGLTDNLSRDCVVVHGWLGPTQILI
jgi:hypothetical protein